MSAAEAFAVKVLGGQRGKAVPVARAKLLGRQLQVSYPAGIKRPRATVARSHRKVGRCRTIKKRLPDTTLDQLNKQHELWMAYASDALRSLPAVDEQSLAQLLQQLDWHGCQLQVVSSRSPSHVGSTGMVLAETSRTFMLLGPGERRVSVLKCGTTFQATLPQVNLGRGLAAKLPSKVLLSGDDLVRGA